MSKAKNRRSQTPKLGGNKEMARAMQEIRRSNATTPVPSGNRPRNRAADKRSWKKEI